MKLGFIQQKERLSKNQSSPLRPMTDAEIERAALDDPDAQPLTEEHLAKARRVSRIKTVRRALRMTQEDFSAAFGIPLGTLRDWEQGAKEPDATARAYLLAIAGDPAAVLAARQKAAA